MTFRALRIAVGIATAGRRDQIPLTIAQLNRQIVLPDVVIVCPANSNDFERAAAAPLACPLMVVFGGQGLCVQRNAILDAAKDCDAVLFLDDDFYPAPDYIEKLHYILRSIPELVVVTNHPVQDGAVGPGIRHEDAIRVIDSLPLIAADQTVLPTYGGYGCNMTIRLRPVYDNNLRFDDQLPFYGWLEDIDFSRRLARFGSVCEYKGLRGVHLGTKKGRGSGLRLGYSQIANPVYMIRKGSMSFNFAARLIVGNVAKNVVRSFWPEEWVDRRGRLAGNALAFFDAVVGRMHPRRVREIA